MTICADEIENSELLSISSDGGNGGSGQDGGNGRDGKSTPNYSDDFNTFKGGFDELWMFSFWSATNWHANTFKQHYQRVNVVEGTLSEYAYGTTSDGVKVLYALINTISKYGFLYSRGKNGYSADGGDAGKGGRPGGGGRGGKVRILKRNGTETNDNHSIIISSHKSGKDGKAGIAGKVGERN